MVDGATVKRRSETLSLLVQCPVCDDTTNKSWRVTRWAYAQHWEQVHKKALERSIVTTLLRGDNKRQRG